MMLVFEIAAGIVAAVFVLQLIVVVGGIVMGLLAACAGLIVRAFG